MMRRYSIGRITPFIRLHGTRTPIVIQGNQALLLESLVSILTVSEVELSTLLTVFKSIGQMIFIHKNNTTAWPKSNLYPIQYIYNNQYKVLLLQTGILKECVCSQHQTCQHDSFWLILSAFNLHAYVSSCISVNLAVRGTWLIAEFTQNRETRTNVKMSWLLWEKVSHKYNETHLGALVSKDYPEYGTKLR